MPCDGHIAAGQGSFPSSSVRLAGMRNVSGASGAVGFLSLSTAFFASGLQALLDESASRSTTHARGTSPTRNRSEMFGSCHLFALPKDKRLCRHSASCMTIRFRGALRTGWAISRSFRTASRDLYRVFAARLPRKRRFLRMPRILSTGRVLINVLVLAFRPAAAPRRLRTYRNG
jgi:hypothetical protein